MLEIKLLRSNAIVPTVAHDLDAAVDLYACLDEPVLIYPGDQVAVPTGIAISLPPSVAGLVLPRSGLARKNKLTIGNTPGLVDPGYQGEVIILLRSFARHGESEPFIVKHGNRIAQLMLVPFLRYPLVVVNDFGFTSDRGASGFGSTGY